MDVSDSGSYVQYAVDSRRTVDVTLAVLHNPCSRPVDVTDVDLGASMGVVDRGSAVAPRPAKVFAVAAAPAVALPAIEIVAVPAGGTIQVIGRFAVTGAELVHVPPATVTFKDGEQPGTLTLTPSVALCTCQPPGS